MFLPQVLRDNLSVINELNKVFIKNSEVIPFRNYDIDFDEKCIV